MTPARLRAIGWTVLIAGGLAMVVILFWALRTDTYAYSSTRTPSVTIQADAIRHWLYTRATTDPEDKLVYQYDIPAVLDILQHSASPIYLICGPRALVLQAIYRDMGWQTRIANIFSTSYDNLRSHTFIEVYDPQIRRWVVEDALYDISYVNAASRVDTATIVRDPTRILPISGRDIGWGIPEIGYMYSRMLGAYRYNAGTIYYNSDRFEPDKYLPDDDMTFREYAAVVYKNVVVPIE